MVSPRPKWKDFYDYSSYRYSEATPQEKERMDNERKEKNRIYTEKNRIFQRNLFYVSVPLGIFCIVAGAILSVQAIGTGLMFGGIFAVTQGYITYWYLLADWMRFVSLLFAFIVLIFVGYRKLAK